MKKYDVFISYSREDARRDGSVKELYERMKKQGIEVWADFTNMNARSISFSAEIEEAIRESEKMLLFVGSSMPKSAYVESELNYAQLTGCKVIPVLYSIESADMQRKFELIPGRFSKKHVYDLTAAKSPEEREAEIDKIIKDVKAPVKLGELSASFKGLPPDYIPRYDYIVRMEDFLFGSKAGVARETVGGFYGRAGIGKSVIANAFCRDAEIREQFPDGIIWLDIKESGNIQTVLDQLRAEHPEIPNAFEEVDIKKAIKEFFNDKSILVVLDDVWERNIKLIDLFYNYFSNTGNKLLVTTRDKSVISAYSSNITEIETLSENEAEKMMLRASRETKLDSSAKEIIKNFNGHTLSIAIACAMRRDGINWRGILRRINRQSRRIQKAMPGYDYVDAFAAIAASINELGKTDEYYKRLAVFPKSSAIPLNAVVVLWKTFKPDIDDLSAEEIVFKLRDKCLLSYDEESQTLYLHDLEYDFLTITIKNIDGLHREFVDVYKQISNGIWTSVEDDGYYYEHIIYHMLSSSENYVRIAETCLSDYSWIKKKMSVCGCSSVLDDYRYAVNRCENYSPLLEMISRSIFLSATFLSTDHRQLPTHLVGRMIGIKDKRIETFLEQIYKTETDFWLRPTAPCMFQADANLANQWSTSSGVIALRCNTKGFVVARKEPDIIHLFDVNSHETVYSWTNTSLVLSVLIDSDDELSDVISSDEEGRVKRWTKGSPAPEVIYSANEPVVYIDRLSDGNYLYITSSGKLILNGSVHKLSHEAQAASFFRGDDKLYIGFSDGYISIVELNGLGEKSFRVAEDKTIDSIVSSGKSIVYELTDNTEDDKKRKSKIILSDDLSDDLENGDSKTVNKQITKTGGLHFTPDGFLVYTDGIRVIARDLNKGTDHIIALNEHWILRSDVIGSNVICVDAYGRIYCFDIVGGINCNKEMYDTIQLRSMINTESMGTLEKGIRGINANAMNSLAVPEHRQDIGIDGVKYCMVVTPEGVAFADENVGLCFFAPGAKQPVRRESLPDRPLCAACFKGKPVIGYEDGSIVIYRDTNTLDGELLGRLPSPVSVICTDGEVLYGASGNGLYKVGGNGEMLSVRTEGCISHISAIPGYVAAVYGNDKAKCYSSGDLSPAEHETIDKYDKKTKIVTAMTAAGHAIYLSEDGKLYDDHLGDYLLEFVMKHNMKDRKAVSYGNIVVYCDRINSADPSSDSASEDRFALKIRIPGRPDSVTLEEINLSIFQTISRYDDYILAASQRDEIEIWDPAGRECIRKICTDSMVRSLSVLSGYIVFVSGSHIFWLKIENKSML